MTLASTSCSGDFGKASAGGRDSLGAGVVKDLNPCLAWHICILGLLISATQAADEARLLLLARAAMYWHG